MTQHLRAGVKPDTNQRRPRKRRSEPAEDDGPAQADAHLTPEQIYELKAARKRPWPNADSAFLVDYLADPGYDDASGPRKDERTHAVALLACAKLLNGEDLYPEENELLVASADAIFGPGNPGQAVRLSAASPLALAISVQAPLANLVAAAALRTALNADIDLALTLLAAGLPFAPPEVFVRWWHQFWNEQAVATARKTLDIPSPLIAPRASWLPPTGGGPNAQGDMPRLLQQLDAMLQLGRAADPVAFVMEQAYPASASPCPVTACGLILSAFRLGALEDGTQAEEATDWIEGVGEQNTHDIAGWSVVGLDADGKQAIECSPVVESVGSPLLGQWPGASNVRGSCGIQFQELSNGPPEAAMLGAKLGTVVTANHIGNRKQLVRAFVAAATIALSRCDNDDNYVATTRAAWTERFGRANALDGQYQWFFGAANKIMAHLDDWFDDDDVQSQLIAMCVQYMRDNNFDTNPTAYGEFARAANGLFDTIREYGAQPAVAANLTLFSLACMHLRNGAEILDNTELVGPYASLPDIIKNMRAILDRIPNPGDELNARMLKFAREDLDDAEESTK
jgi:hypothetical protein